MRRQERRNNSRMSALGGQSEGSFFSRIGGLRVDACPARQPLNDHLVSHLWGDYQGSTSPPVLNFWFIEALVRE